MVTGVLGEALNHAPNDVVMDIVQDTDHATILHPHTGD